MENKEELQEVKKKDGKGLIVLVILLLLICCGLGAFIFMNKDKIFEKEKEVVEKEAVKEDGKEEIDEEIKPLDLNKCLDKTGNLKFSNPKDKGNENVVLKVNSDKRSLTLSINWGEFDKANQFKTGKNGTEEYQITGFSKNVESGFVGFVGQDIIGTTLFYLMEDGTVEYTPLFVNKMNSEGTTDYEINWIYSSMKSKNYFRNNGTVSDVKDVVKLYTVEANTGNTGSHITTIGAKRDGSFYNLYEHMES